MSKKSAERRKENKKQFKMGQLKGKERFIQKKYALMEEILSDERKKEQLLAKEIKDMDKVEKAVAFSLNMRPLTLDEFNEKKEELINAEITAAKHKFAIK